MLIAQVTDTHIVAPGKLANGRVDTAAMLRACVDSVRALTVPPDLLVLTGDLVDAGAADEYAHLKSLLAPLSLPTLVIAGNHDSRDGLRAAFPGLPASGFVHYVHDAGPLRFVALDTLVPGDARGELCSSRLDWLEATLAAEPARPTVVLMHHPPFVTGIGFMDDMGLSGREAFAAIVARHPQVQLILCGHLHRPIHTLVGGRRALTCPSPAHQIPLDLREEPFEGFDFEPPGFMLHRWTGDGFVTHQQPVGNFAGPFPF